MKKFYEIDEIKFIKNKMVIVINKEKHEFILEKISSKLAAASIYELQNFEISPSGYGIHWPAIDEDLSIDGLLGVIHSPKFLKKAV